MQMHPVKSSLITAVGFSDEKEELKVELNNGREYLYEGVTRPIYDALMSAKSVGGFFMRNIKPEFKQTRIR